MSIDELKTEVVKLARREVELTRRKQTLKAQVASEMANVEISPSAGGNDHLERSIIELHALEKAIQKAQEQRLLAVRAKRQGDIEALQNRMEELQKESAALLTKVETHKEVLNKLLGVEIGIVCAMPGQRSRLQQISIMTQGLAEQISSLQFTPLRSDGTVDLMDSTAAADEIALTVLSTDTVCPAVQSILDWLAGFGEVTGHRRVYVTWRNGQIDQSTSYVQPTAAARV